MTWGDQRAQQTETKVAPKGGPHSSVGFSSCGNVGAELSLITPNLDVM